MLIDGVVPVARCHLAASNRSWAFAEQFGTEIAGHWQRRCAENPAFFNGRILVAEEVEITDQGLSARMVEVDFAAFLYWRDRGRCDPPVYDLFGSGIVRTRDGAILVGRQRTGNLNAGLSYPPGGFIDLRDVDATGQVDITRSIRREIAEELGLEHQLAAVSSGYLVTVHRRQVAIAREFRVEMDTQDTLACVKSYLQRDANSEIEEVAALMTRDDMANLRLPDYARILLGHILA